MTKSTVGAWALSGRGRVAYWVSLLVFLAIALIAVLVAMFAPVSLKDTEAPVTRVESTETSRQADGTTTTVERRETTTGAADTGDFLGWRLNRQAIIAIELVVGFVVAYFVAGLVYRSVCGQYAIRMGPVELPDPGHAAPIANAADAASETVDRRRVLAEDTEAAATENIGEGVRPSSESVEDVDVEIAAEDMVFGLRDLNVSLAAVLRQLLTPPSRRSPRNTEDMVRILRTRGVLPEPLADAVDRVLYQCRVLGTGPVRARIDDAAMVYGPRLLADLRALRKTAALAFERYVLDELERVSGWTVNRNEVLGRTQVDATAHRDGAKVIVEVRARIGPGSTGAVKHLEEWLESLPAGLPTLLIIPARPTPSELWRKIENRLGLAILVWDDQRSELTGKLNQLAAEHGARSSS